MCKMNVKFVTKWQLSEYELMKGKMKKNWVDPRGWNIWTEGLAGWRGSIYRIRIDVYRNDVGGGARFAEKLSGALGKSERARAPRRPSWIEDGGSGAAHAACSALPLYRRAEHADLREMTQLLGSSPRYPWPVSPPRSPPPLAPPRQVQCQGQSGLTAAAASGALGCSGLGPSHSAQLLLPNSPNSCQVSREGRVAFFALPLFAEHLPYFTRSLGAIRFCTSATGPPGLQTG